MTSHSSPIRLYLCLFSMSFFSLFGRYLRHEQQSLMAVPRDAILESRVEWGPLPNFKSLKGERNERTDKNNKPKTATERPKGNFLDVYFVNFLSKGQYHSKRAGSVR